ncbi:Rab-GTPase-TBC domain protein [Gregarina niphandrodes]|uniref:Rab-GTPase-TBC domain protein n=1 Tax=Gregarina niphandrodes TaxID=110365 RepID=A0A023BB74_GRENI|nr:Rab-GTPase-TBC domain protein [Gregarina niphandrodes]EZG79250.1 Rab-GTPase-TBC domain protein [Gregarina niphandrodes]|eukprot:XP_011129097.1 Rab-GTPase-TBC domain protein [Gregarina niphandrodes]
MGLSISPQTLNTQAVRRRHRSLRRRIGRCYRRIVFMHRYWICGRRRRRGGKIDVIGGESSSDERDAFDTTTRNTPLGVTLVRDYLAQQKGYSPLVKEEVYIAIRTAEIDVRHCPTKAPTDSRRIYASVGVPDEYKRYVIHRAADLGVSNNYHSDRFLAELQQRVFGGSVPERIEGDLPTFTYGFLGAEKELHQKAKKLDFDVDLGRAVVHHTAMASTGSFVGPLRSSYNVRGSSLAPGGGVPRRVSDGLEGHRGIPRTDSDTQLLLTTPDALVQHTTRPSAMALATVGSFARIGSFTHLGSYNQLQKMASHAHNRTHPSGAGVNGTHPSGIHPSGIHPSGIHPSGIHPSGIHPGGVVAEPPLVTTAPSNLFASGQGSAQMGGSGPLLSGLTVGALVSTTPMGARAAADPRSDPREWDTRASDLRSSNPRPSDAETTRGCGPSSDCVVDLVAGEYRAREYRAGEYGTQSSRLPGSFVAGRTLSKLHSISMDANRRTYLSLMSMTGVDAGHVSNHVFEETTVYASVLTAEGQNVAKKILWMVSSYFPQLEFAPVLVPLTCILLYYVGEGEAVATVIYVLERSVEILKKDKTTRAFLTLRRSEFVRLVKQAVAISEKHLSALVVHLEELGVDLPAWLARGLQDGFSRLLPFDLLVRAYMAFLYDGVKVFLRYAIAMLMMAEDRLMACTTAIEANQVLLFREFRSCDPDLLNDLTKLAFKLRIRKSKKPIHEYTSADVPTPYLTETAIPRFYRPRLYNVSDILTDHMWTCIWRWLPNQFRILDPYLRFTTATDGCSVNALIRAIWPYFEMPMIAALLTQDRDIVVLHSPVTFRPDYKSVMDSVDLSNSFIARLTKDRTPRVYYHQGPGKRIMIVTESIIFGDP